MSYAKIIDFGKTTPCEGTNHPLTLCLQDSMDSNFLNNSMSGNYGPRSIKCSAYMADRCSKTYDGFCEYFYRTKDNRNNETQQPYPQAFTNRGFLDVYGLAQQLSTGEQMLQNTAELRFCEYLNCKPQCEPFDPTDPASPKITFYADQNGTRGNCFPVCRVDPQTIDADPVMDRMIANPRAASSTLINICNTAKREGSSLAGTKIGGLCDRYFRNLS